MEHIIEFELKKETPGTHVYEEQPDPGQPPKVKSLYIQKWVGGKTPPAKITVTIKSN